MTLSQIILLLGSFALVLITYFFAPLTQPNIEQTETPAFTESADSFNYKSYLSEQVLTLDETSANQYTELLAQLEESEGERKTEILETLISFFEDNEMTVIAAVYEKQLAEVEGTEDQWLKAGDALVRAYADVQNPGLSNYLISKAVNCYEQVREINPDNLDAGIKLASAYMEATNQVMQGVTILLEIVEQDPDNISANLILGRYGIISGQFDKAVTRLETVLKADPDNAEALFYLAEAHNGLGNKEKAIELFERCKALVSNPAFSREIDNYIQKLKNS